MKKTLLFSLIFFSSCQVISIPYTSDAKKERPTRTRTSTSRTTAMSHRSEPRIHPKREEIVLEAKKYIGIPYNYGGKKPSSGFDCSGFSTFVYAKAGISLSGSSSHMASLGKHKLFSIEKGDLAFFGSSGKVSHVAIVLEKTKHTFKVIHATSSKGVMISDVQHSEYWKNRYLFSRDVLTNTNHGYTGLDD